MTIKAIPWIAVLTLLLPATSSAQDPMAIVEGAQVYSSTCARCHNARASSERTDLEWIPIVLHMRARANMTKTQARNVLAFLQATNLPPAAGGVTQAGAPPEEPHTVMPSALRTRLIAAWKSTSWTQLLPPRGERNQP